MILGSTQGIKEYSILMQDTKFSQYTIPRVISTSLTQ